MLVKQNEPVSQPAEKSGKTQELPSLGANHFFAPNTVSLAMIIPAS